MNGKANAINAAIDVNAFWAEDGRNAKWVTNGTENHPTTDRTHPGAALMVRAAAGLAPMLNG